MAQAGCDLPTQSMHQSLAHLVVCVYLRGWPEGVSTNIKIVLGLMQVMALLKSVLNIVYPPEPEHVMSFMGLVTADISAVLQFDCWGMDWCPLQLTF